MPQDRLFGYWISVHDETSARDAVRMAGLPILLLGVNAIITFVMAGANAAPSLVAWITGAVGVLLIVMAFRIRSGHAAWIPVAFLLYGTFFAATLVNAAMALQSGDAGRMNGAALLINWVIPILCLIFTIGGLRGWRWLMNHKVRMTL